MLEINDTSVRNMESDDVINKLRAVSLAGQPVKLIVARAVDNPDSEMLLEINDVMLHDMTVLM